MNDLLESPFARSVLTRTLIVFIIQTVRKEHRTAVKTIMGEIPPNPRKPKQVLHGLSKSNSKKDDDSLKLMKQLGVTAEELGRIRAQEQERQVAELRKSIMKAPSGR